MSGHDEGGAAFPVLLQSDGNGDTLTYAEAGMTLRDYFAGKAMAAMIVAGHDAPMRGYEGWRDEFARQAGLFADAMIAERAK